MKKRVLKKYEAFFVQKFSRRDLRLINCLVYDENDLIRCEGRLKHTPLPYDTKTPYLLNSEHYLRELIVKHLYTKLKHISVKQTLTELRQKFCLFRGSNFVWKVLKNWFLCRKYEGPPFQYPITPPLTKLRLFNSYTFYTTWIDNFGPLYVKLNFDSKLDSKPPLHKVYVSLFSFASSRGVILDVVPRLDASSFIRSIKRFISRRGCPPYIISDGGRNFVSVETQEFVTRLGIEWKFNLPLSPWQGGFFKRLVRSTKILLRIELGHLKLNYEQYQILESERPFAFFNSVHGKWCKLDFVLY